MSLITELIRRNVYSERFLNAVGRDSPHWWKSTEIERERSLRHDMVCCLFCNLQTYKKRKSEEVPQPGSSPKKARCETPSTSTSTGNGNSSATDSDPGPGMENLPLEEISKFAEEVLDRPEQGIFRYMIIEGRANEAQFQNYYSNLCGMHPLKSKWDIVDLQEQKFIEIKCTEDRQEAETTFYEKLIAEAASDRNRFSLYWIHPIA